jgi:hypothetical protein
MVDRLSKQWFEYVRENNSTLAIVVMVFSGTGYTVSLVVRDLIKQVACEVASPFDIQSRECSDQTMSVIMIELVIVTCLAICGSLIVLRCCLPVVYPPVL